MQLDANILSPESMAFWSRVGTAFLAGGAIGIERQRRGKVAGIRTSILICLGTELFVSLGAIAQDGSSDPTRVLGQVVTGIGFLGGGVILSRGDRVMGVTTASVIWMLAAIGSLIGFGYLGAAVVIAAISLVVLRGVEHFDDFSGKKEGPRGSGMFHTPEE